MTRTSSAKSPDLRRNTWLRCSTSSPTSAPGNLAAPNTLHIHARRRQMKPQKPRRLFQRREPSGGRAAGILAVSRESVRTFCGVSSRQTHLGAAGYREGCGAYSGLGRTSTTNGNGRRKKQTAVRLHHSSAHNCFNEAALLTGSLLLLFSSFSKKHNNTHGLLISKTKQKILHEPLHDSYRWKYMHE